MTLTLIFIGIILGGILSLLSLVFTIISLVNRNSKRAFVWGGTFILSLIILIFSISQLAARAAEKMKTGLEWVKEHGNDMTDSNFNNDQKIQRQNWLDTLQAYNMDKYDGKVPPDFYINKPAVKDAAGNITIPFIYPYLIRYNCNSSTGDLFMEDSDSVFVDNIAQIAFDNNFAIIKVDNSKDSALLKKDHSEIEYLLYDMRTRNFEPAKNYEKLIDLGKRIGYTGTAEMNYLSDDYKGWIEPAGND